MSLCSCDALRKALSSSLARKYFMSVSGLGLVGFVIAHLVGNLTLLEPSGAWFNQYAAKLESYGPMLYAAEVGLVGIFLLHVVMAIWVTLENKRARPVGYSVQASKHGPSKSSWGSRNMIITGIVLLVFLIVHLKNFKFGPGIAEGYVTSLHGESARDLHRTVVEAFQNPWLVTFYVGCMVLLGIHLRHGFWSAFQSLGLMYHRMSAAIYCLAWFLAVALALGFVVLPIWLHFNVGGMLK